MKRRGLILLATVLLATVPAAAVEVYAEVNLAPLSRSYGMPSLGRKQGWLTISNRDWQQYTVIMDGENLNLYQGGYGGYGDAIAVPSGTTVTIALEKDTYRLRGNNGNRLNVKVREGRTTTLSLEPFGYVGSSGLRAIANDGERVRDEVLFDAMTVVVQPAPPIIINRPPPPPVIVRPPVVIERPRPPVIVQPGRPGHRPPSIIQPGRPGHRPPPGRPPHRPNQPNRPNRPNRPGHKNDGWGFSFSFGN